MLLKDFAKIFFIILVIQLVAIDVGEDPILIYFSKPMILGSLIVFFIHHTENRERFEQLFLYGLSFSLLGDVLLMFTDRGENYFIFGLIAFLIAQLMFTFAYVKEGKEEKGLLRKQPWLALPLYAVGVGIIWMLRDGLGDLAIPIIAYAFVIVTMANAALNRYGRVSSKSFWLVFIGALFFVVSDTAIAYDKFVATFPYHRIVIMSTYGIAQFLMLWGILERRLKV